MRGTEKSHHNSSDCVREDGGGQDYGDRMKGDKWMINDRQEEDRCDHAESSVQNTSGGAGLQRKL